VREQVIEGEYPTRGAGAGAGAEAGAVEQFDKKAKMEGSEPPKTLIN
jgi:hypothetical protein